MLLSFAAALTERAVDKGDAVGGDRGTGQPHRLPFAVTFLVSREPVNVRSIWLYLAALFLLLYYAVWIRYLVNGREVVLLHRAFLFVPMPLAVFPVLYYLCAAVWLRNIPATVIMAIFGAAHLTVSLQSFR